MIRSYFQSSIGKKQVIAITGLMMVLFLIGHLSGNFLIFKGAEAFNDYAAFLQSLGGLLWVARIGLLLAVILHITFTISLVLQNKRARGTEYDMPLHKPTRSFTAQTMRYSGLILIAYIITHLLDYSLGVTAHDPILMGQDMGLYGVVINSFKSPFRVLWYVVAMLAVGMHLTHAVQSLAQTLGVNHPRYTPVIKQVSVGTGLVVALGFASIPIFVNFISCSACAG